VTTGGVTAYRHSIEIGDSTAIYTRYSSGAAAQTFYAASDHIGSYSSITDASGAVVVKESFDAFGKRRGTNWTGLPTSADLTTIGNTTRRGFTEHEHLDNVGLIHMNGRVQDPTLGRFLSADPLSRDTPGSQELNRYSYARNNPLTRTDPSGFVDGSVMVEASRFAGEVDLPGDKLSLLLSDWLQSGISGAPSMEAQGSGSIGTVTVQASRITAARMIATGSASLGALTVAGLEASTIENVTVVATKPRSTGGMACVNGRGPCHMTPLPPVEVDWTEVAGAVWPGYALGTCIYSGECGAWSWTAAIVGAVPIPGATEVGAATKAGTSVLGHFPVYLEKAAELGARRFSIPPNIWAKMSSAEQWAANQKFLDRLILRGDQVVLTTPIDAVRAGSSLEREVQYLLGRGYRAVDDGLTLVPGP
jgi:RHS repeat-associated protein